jgi:hypothetical protein
MKNNADIMTGLKQVDIQSQFISVSVNNPLVAFYDNHGRKGDVLFFCSVPDTTRDLYLTNIHISVLP